MDDYGIKYPCYGEYKCPKCKRVWWSNQAWRYDGQECKRCNIKLNPNKVEPLYSFACPAEECGFQWKNKKVDVSCCSKCGTPGKMFETPKERREYLKANKLAPTNLVWDNKIRGKETGHINELCERCQKSNYKDCKRQALEDRAAEKKLMQKQKYETGSYPRRSTSYGYYYGEQYGYGGYTGYNGNIISYGGYGYQEKRTEYSNSGTESRVEKSFCAIL